MIGAMAAASSLVDRDPRPVLVAPDAFKGTFTAEQVAGAIAEGIRAEGLPVDRCPRALARSRSTTVGAITLNLRCRFCRPNRFRLRYSRLRK